MHRSTDGRRKAKRIALEAAMYDGQRLAGTVRARGSMFLAFDIEQRLIGEFKTLRAAMRACGGAQ
jgi:hypothetical protein